VVTRQPQVERRTAKVPLSETDVLPLAMQVATNQLYVTELNTSRELLLLIFCISQGIVHRTCGTDNTVTYLRCVGKYDMILVANLLLSTTAQEFF